MKKSGLIHLVGTGSGEFEIECHTEDEHYWYGYDLNEPNAPYRRYGKSLFYLANDRRDEIDLTEAVPAGVNLREKKIPTKIDKHGRTVEIERFGRDASGPVFTVRWLYPDATIAKYREMIPAQTVQDLAVEEEWRNA